MGRKDTVTKDYMKNTKVFADAFNYFLYSGKQVIDPTKLHVQDTTEIAMPYGDKKTVFPVQKYRDNLDYLSAMQDDHVAYLLLGIENQAEIHHAMAVKNMVYDALQYASQVEKAAKFHREKKSGKQDRKKSGREVKKPDSGEYLSGFYKEDRLLPVITLVILFNADPWDGAMSIHEMLTVPDEGLLQFIPDYRINLIAPAQMNDESIDKLKTSLREVLLYIKYSKNKKKLKELLTTDDRFKKVEKDAVIVINTLTNSQFKIDEKEEIVDMCQAMVEIRAEMREELIEEVREEVKAEVKEEVKAEVKEEVKAEVKEEVKAEVKEEVKAETRKEEKVLSIRSLMKTVGFTAKQAMNALQIPEEECAMYEKLL